MQFEILAFAAGSTITILLLTTGHWMPWDMTRIQAYVYGTVSILTGFSIWRLVLGDWLTPLGLLIIAVLGGATVKLAYTTDDTIREVREARMRREVDEAHIREAEIQKRVDDAQQK